MSFDVERAQELALDVWKFKQGEVVSAMIHLGDALGIYRAMAGHDFRSPAEISSLCQLDERWIEEWLLGQAAAGIIDRTEDGRYALSAEAAAVLVDEESLLFAAGAFVGGNPPDVLQRVKASFETGVGFTYGSLGTESAEQLDRMNGPSLRNFLLSDIVARLDGIPERLSTGGRMIDVGCGGGVALQAFAVAFPGAELVGVDPSAAAIEVARRRLAAHPNVTVYESSIEEIPDGAPFDLVTTLDCMHDMSRPDIAARQIKDHLALDGAWLIKDIKCGPTYESNQRNPLLAMQYGFSVLSCLASATSTEDGLGLGTLGFHPERAREITAAAGFSSIAIIDSDDPAHLYYEVRH